MSMIAHFDTTHGRDSGRVLKQNKNTVIVEMTKRTAEKPERRIPREKRRAALATYLAIWVGAIPRPARFVAAVPAHTVTKTVKRHISKHNVIIKEA